MKNPRGTAQKCEQLKSHIVVSIIRAQEEADRMQAECGLLKRGGGNSHTCRERHALLQRKVARYLKHYQTLKAEPAKNE